MPARMSAFAFCLSEETIIIAGGRYGKRRRNADGCVILKVNDEGKLEAKIGPSLRKKARFSNNCPIRYGPYIVCPDGVRTGNEVLHTFDTRCNQWIKLSKSRKDVA